VRELLDGLAAWRAAGRTVVLATVVASTGSAPRELGAAMAVGFDGTGAGAVLGSVSGGCVEAELYELARSVAADGTPRVRGFGVTADDLAAGLSCGGEVSVHLCRVDLTAARALDGLAAAVAAGRPAALATRLDTGDRLLVVADPAAPGGHRGTGGLGAAALDAAVRADAVTAVATDRCGIRRHGGVDVFVQAFPPPPGLLLVGAVDVAAAVARLGAAAGYRVTVCDPRPLFATAARFPDAEEVVVDWPHRWLGRLVGAGAVDGRTAVCLFGHDQRVDVPLLEVALRAPVGYVGAMGSRATHADRLDRLRAHGLTDVELGRLSGPIGLDLGGRTPQETALAVLAEIVAVRHGGSGLPLSRTSGAIHRPGERRGPALSLSVVAGPPPNNCAGSSR
jgi:xanthine dehydrogenase accessory factor